MLLDFTFSINLDDSSIKKYVFSLFFAKRIYTFVPLYNTKPELLINTIRKRDIICILRTIYLF